MVGLTDLPNELHLNIANSLDSYDLLHLSLQSQRLHRVYRDLFFKSIVTIRPITPDEFEEKEDESEFRRSFKLGLIDPERWRPMELWRRKLLLAPHHLFLQFLNSGNSFLCAPGANTLKDLEHILLVGFCSDTKSKEISLPSDLASPNRTRWVQDKQKPWYLQQNISYIFPGLSSLEWLKRERFVNFCIETQDHFILDLLVEHGLLRLSKGGSSEDEYNDNEPAYATSINRFVTSNPHRSLPKTMLWALKRGGDPEGSPHDSPISLLLRSLLPHRWAPVQRRTRLGYSANPIHSPIWEEWDKHMTYRARRIMDMVNILVKYGGDINCTNAPQSPLYELFPGLFTKPHNGLARFIFYGWLNILFPRLLHLGIDFNPPNPESLPFQIAHPLHWALEQLVYQLGEPVTKVPSLNVAQLVEFTKRIITSGKVDIEFKDHRRNHPNEGYTPLFAALHAHLNNDNFVDVREVCIGKGGRDYNIAFLEIIRCLLHHGADLNERCAGYEGKSSMSLFVSAQMMNLYEYSRSDLCVLEPIIRKRDSFPNRYAYVDAVKFKAWVNKKLGIGDDIKVLYPYYWGKVMDCGVEPFGTVDVEEVDVLADEDGVWGEWWEEEKIQSLSLVVRKLVSSQQVSYILRPSGEWDEVIPDGGWWFDEEESE